MIRCRTRIRLDPNQAIIQLLSRHLSTSTSHKINRVKQLPSWNLTEFRENAFNAQLPTKLPADETQIPRACHRWFTHSSNDLSPSTPSHTTRLQPSFWSEHESTIVPLELTTATTSPQFTRTEAPLSLLLTHLNNPSPSTSIYLAQCPLTTLPSPLQSDLPTPTLVTHAGKGDIYASSLWLGHAPTYTPLHRDPNPNLFMQLAGTKSIRLLPPAVGDAVFDDVQSRLASHGTSSRFRGEEMMAGPERAVLHRIVWEDGGDGVMAYACEARLGVGEALFIPKGWWHSVKGVGEGVNASVNWWFR